MQEISLEAKVDNLDKVLSFVEDAVSELDCSIKVKTQLDIAVEEIFVNIAHYAYKPGTGMATLQFEAYDNPASVSITFIDSGIPYDPLKKEDPDVSLPAEERQIGGLGIFMVKKSMDEMTYRHENGKNILCIKKLL